MPVHASSIKQQRKSKVRKERNQAVLSRLKTQIKKAKAALATKDPGKIQQALTLAASALSKAASKKVIHKNKASRTISRLNRAAHQLLPKTASGQGAKTASQPAS